MCFIFILITIFAYSETSRLKRIVGGHEAKPPPQDDPVVFTRIFKRDARIEGLRNLATGIYHFWGIYYAEAPIGANRYARPVYKRLAGDINATQHGPPCLQQDPHIPHRIIGNENCLLVDIYTPQMPDETSGLPVIIWIHPGGFRFGSAAQYDATPIAQKRVIVVTPQYRLGSLGIMGDGTKEFNGNLSIFDMAAALRWVHDYISFFGGDPKQIKVLGHGSGAVSAMYLSMSKTARNAGHISGIIALSGTVLGQYVTDKEPILSVHEIAKINGCPTTNELEIVNCLREKTALQIVKNDYKIQIERLAGRAMIKSLAGSLGFQPHIEYENDGRALPSIIEQPFLNQLETKNFIAVPLLTGVTKHETGKGINLTTINQVYGSVESFINSVTHSLKELNKFLRMDQISGEITKAVLPDLYNNLTPTLEEFMSIPETFKVDQVVSKITESTTDILFNLPAILTTQLWSRFAPSFMYSFEYKGKTSKGINFLQGLPIVSNDNERNQFISHGDELGYIFDCNDIYGNPIKEISINNSDDIKVRSNIIEMITKFVSQSKKHLNIYSFNDNLFKSVTGSRTPFIKIHTNLELADDFRFCELSVLGASLNPTTSTTCENFGNIFFSVTDKFKNLANNLPETNINNIFNNTNMKTLDDFLKRPQDTENNGIISSKLFG